MENLSTGSLMRLKVSLSKQMWWSLKWISFFFAISSHQWHIYGGMGSYKYFHSYYLHNKLMFHVPMTWLHIDCNLGQDATDRHASITTSQQQSYFFATSKLNSNHTSIESGEPTAATCKVSLRIHQVSSQTKPRVNGRLVEGTQSKQHMNLRLV